MSEWQDISSAPRDGQTILVWSPNYGGRVAMVYFDPDRFAKRPTPRWTSSDRIYGRVDFVHKPPTHWMPLPPPPPEAAA